MVLDPEKDRNKFIASVAMRGLHFLDEKDHIHIQGMPAGWLYRDWASDSSEPATAPEGGQEHGGIPLERPAGPPIQSERT